MIIIHATARPSSARDFESCLQQAMVASHTLGRIGVAMDLTINGRHVLIQQGDDLPKLLRDAGLDPDSPVVDGASPPNIAALTVARREAFERLRGRLEVAGISETSLEAFDREAKGVLDDYRMGRL
jgi:hypothetical protein